MKICMNVPFIKTLKFTDYVIVKQKDVVFAADPSLYATFS